MLTYFWAVPAERTPAQRVPAMLSAPLGRSRQPHGKDNCGSLYFNKTVLFVNCGDNVVIGGGEHHSVGLNDNVGVLNELDEARGIFGAGQLLAEVVQTEAGVYALLKDTAESLCALEYDYLFNAAFTRLERGGHACGASADNGKIIFKH